MPAPSVPHATGASPITECQQDLPVNSLPSEKSTHLTTEARTEEAAEKARLLYLTVTLMSLN